MQRRRSSADNNARRSRIYACDVDEERDELTSEIDELRSLNNNLELSIAAYNGGEGRIDRLAGGGARSFWDASVYYALPPETRDYVPVVLAAAYLFLHPERYNLKFPQIDARTATVSLKTALSLNELTLCLGQEGTSARGWFRQLRNLNPRYEPNDPIAAGTALVLPAVAAPAYDRNCADGPMLAMSTDLHSAHPPTAPKNLPNRLRSKGLSRPSSPARQVVARATKVVLHHHSVHPVHIARPGALHGEPQTFHIL